MFVFPEGCGMIVLIAIIALAVGAILIPFIN